MSGPAARPLRVALVGAGDIARTAHLPALLREPAVELVAVVDPDARARERAAAALPAPAALHADVDALAGEAAIDAWVVATPPWVTPALVRRGLDAGRFVLAEKPLATTVAAARAALDGLRPEQAARLQAGFSYRHDPAVEQLRELVSSGALGPTLHVRVAVYDEQDDPRDAEHGARVRDALAHGLPIVHDGAHIADWLRFLLGPEELAADHAWSLRTRAELPADNVCGATLAHPDGHRVQVEVGWLLPAPAPSMLTVRGAGGCAELDVMTLGLRWDDGTAAAALRGHGERAARCFARQLERFVALCRGDLARAAGAAGAPTLADGLASLAMTERLATAMEERR